MGSSPYLWSFQGEKSLRYAAKTNYRTENYQLARHFLENGMAALQVSLDEIQVELFASQQQHIMQLYCSKHLNIAFRFFSKAMGLAYANPPFSLLAKVLTKITYEGGRVDMCTPGWGCSGEHAYWRRMLDRNSLTVPFMCLRTQTQLCRPLSGPVSYPLSMDPSRLYPCVIWIRCYRKRSWPKIVA